MAKAELDILLDKMRGRVTGKSKFYTTHRNGRTVISNYPLERDPKSYTEHQRELNAQFTQAVKQCKLEMQNPARLTYWQDRYAQYTKSASKNEKSYSTLRGFIIAQLRAQNNLCVPHTVCEQ